MNVCIFHYSWLMVLRGNVFMHFVRVYNSYCSNLTPHVSSVNKYYFIIFDAPVAWLSTLR